MVEEEWVNWGWWSRSLAEEGEAGSSEETKESSLVKGGPALNPQGHPGGFLREGLSRVPGEKSKAGPRLVGARLVGARLRTGFTRKSLDGWLRIGGSGAGPQPKDVLEPQRAGKARWL